MTQEQWEALIAFANSLDRTKYMTQEEIEKWHMNDYAVPVVTPVRGQRWTTG